MRRPVVTTATRDRWRAARLIRTAGRALTGAAVGLSVGQAVAGFGFMLAVANLVGRVPAAARGEDAGVPAALAVLLGAYLAQQLLADARILVTASLGRRFATCLEDRVMAAVLRPHGIGHLEDPRPRNLAVEASDGLGGGRWRPDGAPRALASLLEGLLSLVLAFGAVLVLSWWLGLLLAGSLLWALRELDRRAMRSTLDNVDERGQAEFRRAEYEFEFAVGPTAAKEVRLFGFAPWILGRVRERMHAALGMSLRRLAVTPLAEVAGLASLVLVVSGGFVWTGLQLAGGELSVAAATLLVQALLAPVGRQAAIAQALLDVRMTLRPPVALGELERMLAAGCTANRSPSAEPADPHRRTGPGVVRFEDVWFRYPGSSTDVLRGVDLELRPGSSLALVGPNGCGKTTVVKLLCRFYEPTAGRITVDGADIAGLHPATWQRSIAAIFQDFARFPMTARDNIGLGAAATNGAAALTGVDAVVQALPNGWDTPLSPELTGGTDLSGGQWQRVALARALAAAGAGAWLLVLDEPAANLDIRGEAGFNERFLDLTGGSATLVISHRFSTVRRAGRIAVLDHGRITEVGSHDELLAADRTYAALFRVQAERFA